MPKFDGEFLLDIAPQFIGQELAVSDWLVIDQKRVSAFAEATFHDHWMHVDRKRSEAESPYGSTLVQGFLISSLVIYFIDQTGLRPSDAAYALNYGYDKVRFLAPVVTGDGVRVRDRITLLDAQFRDDGNCLMKTAHEIELEGQDKLVAYVEWLALWVRQKTSGVT